jgi:hypothetical protein
LRSRRWSWRWSCFCVTGEYALFICWSVSFALESASVRWSIIVSDVHGDCTCRVLLAFGAAFVASKPHNSRSKRIPSIVHICLVRAVYSRGNGQKAQQRHGHRRWGWQLVDRAVSVGQATSTQL